MYQPFPRYTHNRKWISIVTGPPFSTDSIFLLQVPLSFALLKREREKERLLGSKRPVQAREGNIQEREREREGCRELWRRPIVTFCIPASGVSIALHSLNVCVKVCHRSLLLFFLPFLHLFYPQNTPFHDKYSQSRLRFAPVRNRRTKPNLLVGWLGNGSARNRVSHGWLAVFLRSSRWLMTFLVTRRRKSPEMRHKRLTLVVPRRIGNNKE